MLAHGNAFWAGAILLAWYLMDYGRRSLVVPFGYLFLGGALLTFGPYLAVVLTRWHDVQVQIGNFAGDRVPAWQPSAILHHASLGDRAVSRLVFRTRHEHRAEPAAVGVSGGDPRRRCRADRSE